MAEDRAPGGKPSGKSGPASLDDFVQALEKLPEEISQEEVPSEKTAEAAAPAPEPGARRRERRHAQPRLAAAENRFLPPSDAETWMVSYMDLVTLLLSIFIVMVSLREITAEPPADTRPAPQAVVSLALPPKPADTALAEIRDILKRSATEHLADVVPKEGGISLRIKENALFPSGEADLTDKGRGLLDNLGRFLAAMDKLISVEGHTDDVPISLPRFPSNWELSSARADRVVRYLVSQGIPPARLRAIGYADTRPQASNETDEGRALNRRVNIVIHDSSDF